LSQVSKISRIVIASVLKPVDETRMFEKLGSSLSEKGNYEIHIVGFPSRATPPIQSNSIQLHTISKEPFTRLSLKRLAAPWKVFRIVMNLKPAYLIITTHELLIVAVLCRLFSGCKILYDVQENYFRNILYTTAFPVFIRPFLAGWVRLKEFLTSPFINLYILAEKGYAHELPFALPHITLQNKITYKIAEHYRKAEQTGYSKLIFSGTLAETTGVYHALELVKNLHQFDESITLTIIGSCSSTVDWNNLKQQAAENPFIIFKGEPYPLPHHEILNELRKADFGIIWYPRNAATECSIPTKLFEYMGLNLPILIAHNEESHNLVTTQKAGIVLSQPIDYQQLLAEMQKFKHNPAPAHDYLENEFSSLLSHLKN